MLKSKSFITALYVKLSFMCALFSQIDGDKVGESCLDVSGQLCEQS